VRTRGPPVLLRRNFGQTAAFSAGFDRSRAMWSSRPTGPADEPSDIPALVAKLDAEDLDMVRGCGGSARTRFEEDPSFFANRSSPGRPG